MDVEETDLRLYELAIAFFGALPNEHKMKLAFAVNHDPHRILREIIPTLVRDILTLRQEP